MVQPFNVQALNDPGVGAAASAVSNGLSTVGSLLANRRKNQMDLITSLLGLAGKNMDNETEMRKASALVPGQLSKTIDDSIKASQGALGAGLPGASDAALRQAELAGKQLELAQMGIGGYQPKQYLGTKLLGGLKNKIGGMFDGKDENAMGPSELIQGVGERAPDAMKNEQGAIIGYANKDQEPVAEPVPEPSARLANSPYGQQLAADTVKKVSEAKDAELKTFSPEFFEGKPNEKGEQVAVDTIGEPLDIKMTPKIKALRRQYASDKTYSAEKRQALNDKVESSTIQLDSLAKMTEASIRLREEGWLARAYRSGLIDDGPLGKVYRLAVPENAPASVKADIELYNNQASAAMQKVRELQGSAQGISNRDITQVLKTLGDPSMNTDVFVSTISRSLGNMYSGALQDAVKEGTYFNQLHGQYKQLTGGNPIDLDAINPSEAARNQIYNRYKSILGKGLKYQPPIVQKQSSRNPASAVPATQETRQQRAARLGAL